ncbi:MAG: carbonic anhydrase [Promethearchaeota archaeon]
METKVKFLSDYEIETESESAFQLIPSSAKQYFITLSLLGVILVLMILLVIFAEMVIYMLIYAIFMSIVVIFATPILWNKVFQRFIKNSLVPAMGAIEEEQNRTNAIEFIRNNIVLACLDSRISVDLIFDAVPGEILVMKNAGNEISEDVWRSLLLEKN